MTMEMKIYGSVGDSVYTNPKYGDVRQAIEWLRSGKAELFDLYQAGSDDVLQVVERRGIGVALFRGEQRPMLYSEMDVLDDDDIVAICMHYLRTATIDKAPIEFSQVDWEDRLTSPPQTQRTAESEEPVDTGEQDQNNPQSMLNFWMEDQGSSDVEWLDEAIAGGASFAAFSSIPPLIYLAQHHGHPNAVKAVVAHGELITATHDGHTAFWHAITNNNYRFADALLRAGALENEAASSQSYSKWKRRVAERRAIDDDQLLQEAVSRGDIHVMRSLLKSAPPRQRPLAFAGQAIYASQPEALRVLLEFGGPISMTQVGPNSLWGVAMAQQDPAYIATLIEFGAYDRVASLDDYGGREFKFASAQVLCYLFENGYTAGFGRALHYIVRNREKAEALLPLLPPEYFACLAPGELMEAINILLAQGLQRIDSILEQSDFAAAIDFAFAKHSFYNFANPEVGVPALLGIDIVGPWPRRDRSREAERFRLEVRRELVEQALSIWKS